jgi:protoporphyrinogen oxidase
VADESRTKRAVIIGAGPAGLTAAFELLARTAIVPVIFEASDAIGGISQTITYKGNRMDIGGHRFFSKSDRVMDWWLSILPLQATDGTEDTAVDITYRRQTRSVTVPGRTGESVETDDVMLVRHRLSRIYFLRRFFDYPVTLSPATLRNLGAWRTLRIGASYALARVRPIKPERSLQDFMINRFGTELYRTFFKDYTEKVWGVPCDQIAPEWGAQRIKGVSISKAVLHAARQLVSRDKSVRQKSTETSLIEQFLYPKYGPGQMWEEVARRVEAAGGTVRPGHKVTGITTCGNRVTGVTVKDERTGKPSHVDADYVFSTMPVKDLIAALDSEVPEPVRATAEALPYRDFVTVGVLVRRLTLPGGTGPTNLVPDNWIYIQERDVKIGRLQIFNNWSPYLVADPEHTVWLGLEYFCNEGDELWSKKDEDFFNFAVGELAKIGVIDNADVLDGTVRRVPKTYPAYFGAYNNFDEIRAYVDRFENLYLLGRNGMHRYNNADHSMLTAMTAVDNIVAGIVDKSNIWSVNTEEDYHEEIKEPAEDGSASDTR